MTESKPDNIDITLDRMWTEIYGTNGKGILKKLNELKDQLYMIEKTIDDYISIEKDFKIQFLEERAKQGKERFWKILGTIASLSGWAAFVVSVIVSFNV